MAKMFRAGVLLLACLFAGLPLQAQTPPPPYGPPINIEAAKRVAAAAIAEARRNNFTMAIAVVDSGGQLVYFERQDNTQIGSIDVAIGKARSSNNFRRPTKAFEDGVAGGRNAILGLQGAVPIEGGVLLLADGRIVGAIGVSGGTAPQDGQVAAVGAAALQAR